MERVLEKLIVTQLVKEFSLYIKSDDSLLHSQQHTTAPALCQMNLVPISYFFMNSFKTTEPGIQD
jgi:hypothetical protein